MDKVKQETCLFIFELLLGWTPPRRLRTQALELPCQRSRPLHGLRVVAPVPPLWGTREVPQDSETHRQSRLPALGFKVRLRSHDREKVSAPRLVDTPMGCMLRLARDPTPATVGPLALEQ